MAAHASPNTYQVEEQGQRKSSIGQHAPPNAEYADFQQELWATDQPHHPAIHC
jgi:hypothetical protein